MRIIYVIVFALALSSTVMAQANQNRKDRIEKKMESRKIAYITQGLDLSPAEAQQFWPIYNEYQSKIKESRKNNRVKVPEEDLSDDDANEFLDNLLEREQNELNLKRDYFDRMKTVVSAKKVAKLYILEKKFREEVLADIKGRMENRRRNNRNKRFD